jgi:hypothetical protein
MATLYPTALDGFNNPSATDQLGSSFVPHHQQHTDANDAIEALQAKVGVDNSADPTSIEYRLTQTEKPGPFYGEFYNTTDITFVANTPKAIPFPLTLTANGISVGSPDSRIVIANAGIYNIALNLQLLSSAPALIQSFVWLRKNGVDIPNSSAQLSLTTSNYAVVAAWNFYGTLAAGDYVEVIVASDNAALTLDSDVAVVAPYPRPAAASAIVTLRQIDR